VIKEWTFRSRAQSAARGSL